ncbi:non-ribosomal peptide synthetase/type I polyketide synthase [Mycoplana rhizolycopersici]|uniref:Amino acid adenylation domain-containing protein n=1 Tax=Mycoplana rhizolycopersici TaxID=2746702 RepID=A0ABX2Q8B7_9HYPH|nr:non-ribosomal peptide synthetase/type I polyketide synthase [Rhizobium rhizolycopersici]NVP53967.1 amino acid adenylation domain-containing protein [Rhizobium rhizolycopersici]
MDKNQPDNRIAIVGRAGRFPSARNVSDFWTLLSEGRSAEQRLGEADLIAAGVSRKRLADPAYVRVAHVLPDMECFDASFFGFSPREASILDPQHRHFLECGWEALEDAGYVPERFDGRIGVFAGSGMQAYLPFNLLSNPDLVEEIGLFLLRHTGNDKDFLPTRLSYLLNLTGPSVAVQTACSTSLVAVHTAIGSLLNMECDMAIAGGVTIELPHRTGYRYAEGEILSPDGLCRAFDDDSKGTVFGSGAALVVLRRFEDAVADGDDIKAVILASAVNNDGAGKASYLAPSVDGQAEAAAEALALSGIEARDLSYIETHGTGTPIGDPIELAALKQVYGAAPAGSIGIGSVKTNIGHLDTAAGAASLIKVVEALRHRRLPASLHFRKPNSRFDFKASPFQVVAEGREWAATSSGPRRAAVNSLGVGGTNAHVIVEEAPERQQPAPRSEWRLFPFSARSTAALERQREQWKAFAGGELPAIEDVAFTLREGRRHFPERFAIAARSGDDLKGALTAKATPLRRHGKAGSAPPRIIFLFPGGGAQYPGAGAGMMAASPVFASAVDQCFALLPDSVPSDLRQVMFGARLSDDKARGKLGRSSYAIPALFILEYAYSKLWESWGVRPDAIVAHSVGEYAGAVAAGVMELADALRIVTLRGQVMEQAPAGAMTAVPLGEVRVRELIGEGLDIAAVNSAQSTVVSGPVAGIEALEARLAGSEHEARRIHIDVAAHSRQLDDQLERFREGLQGISFREPTVPMVSSLRGSWGDGQDFVSIDYWVRHLRHTVRFADAVAAVLEAPDSVVIEVGPGQTVGPLVAAATTRNAPRAILPSAPRPRDAEDEMGVAVAALGGLWANGFELDARRLPGREGRRVSLPTYPFEKERHWISPGRGKSGEATEDPAPVLARIADPSEWVEVLGWAERPRSGVATQPGGDWLVLAGDDAVSEAVLARLSEAGARVSVLRVGDAFAAAAGGYVLRPDAQEDFEALAVAMPSVPAKVLVLWELDPAVAHKAFAASYLLARFLQQSDPEPGTRLVIAAAGTVAFPDEQPERPTDGALLGIVRVAPREVPGMSAALVDLAPSADPATVAALIAEAAADGEADHVALRGKRRFVQTRSRVRAPAPARLPERLRAGGAYLITGGTGGIGRQLALWLAKTAGARLALLSRSAAEDAALRAEIEAAGGAVLFLAADVADEAAVARTIETTRSRFGALHGVVHAAGVLNDAPLASQPLAEALAVMRPKLEGAMVLSRLLPVGSLDLFAVISSSSVVIGGAGQAAYAAANAALESLAAARSDGFSIAWGAWRDTGMAARAYGAGDHAEGDALLGQRIDTPDGSVRFETVIDPQTDWRVSEHVVAGRPVLCGTAYMELAQAAARVVMRERSFELAALSFALPMTFEDMPRRVAIRLQPRADGYDMTIESSVGSEREPTEHVRLQVLAMQQVDDRLPRALGVALLKGTKLDGGKAPQQGTIAFGPRWNCIEALRAGDGVAEGEFRLSEAFVRDLEAHNLHPALMDMAATVGLLTVDRLDGKLWVPMSIGRMRVFGPVPAAVTGRAVRVGGEAGRFSSFDVAVLDDAGRPVVILENFAMRAVELDGFGAAAKPSLTTQLLATGIRVAEAPELFPRVFAHPGRQLVVSPVSLDHVRLAIAEVAAPPSARPARQGGGGRISDPITAQLSAIWGEILGVSDVGPEDDFFALGGHSLNAVRMFARVRKDLGASLPLASLFQASTLSGLAALVREQVPGGEAMLPPPAAVVPPAQALAPAQATATEVRRLGMTEGQREIAAAISINPSASLSYNLSFSLHLDTAIDAGALQTALEDLVARHDSLRASFDVDNVTLTIHPRREVSFEEEDMSSLCELEQRARRNALHADFGARPFDLVNGPVLRTLLLRLAPAKAEIILLVHHIACDGWSMGVLLSDLAQLYSARLRGRQAALPPATSIADLVAAETEWASSADAARHRAYWLEKYAGPLPAIDIPTDWPYPVARGTQADRVETRIDAGLEAALRARAQEAGTSLRNLVFSAFRYYLSRLTRSSDVVIGLPASGQLSHRLEAAVGHAVSLLPVRGTIKPDVRLGELLSQTRQELLEALDHQNYTYGSLMRDLQMPRDPSRLALVPVVVNIDGLADIGELLFGDAPARVDVNSTGHEYFELFFNLFESPGRVELSWNYATELFEKETITHHATNFRQFLDAIASAPDGLKSVVSTLLRGDASRPASGSHIDPAAAGPQTIPEIFRAVVARAPNQVAVRYLDQAMDYATLDARTDALAALLASEGVRHGDLVGISSSRSLLLPVAVMGALKAGAGYVPFDVTLPPDRLQFMARDTGIKVLLGDCDAVAVTGVRTIRMEDFPTEVRDAPEPGVTGETIAYVMFTSGTTGVPKGVVLPHRSVIRLLRDTDWLRLGPETVTLHSSAFAFDTSIIDLFAALLHGGTIVVPPDGTLSISDLSDAIESNGVNTLWLTSGLFHAVADMRPGAFARVDQVVVGGDVVSPVHVAQVMAACPGLTVINGYGPTESNVTNAHAVSAGDLERGLPLPIGKAIPGTQIYILDDALQPVPTGMIGELCIAGRGLALGYWNRPELTAQRFVKAPWDPQLALYRSGDLAMDPGDGIIRFFGRADTQVKVRGFRVELTEIEGALESHPAIRQAVAVARVPEGQSDKILVAYFLAEGEAPSSRELSEHVAAMLPEFARPAFYVPVDEIPLNHNGKVDRCRLPAVRLDAVADPAAEKPQGEMEIRLAQIWCEVLGVERVGACANFFALGGHSLLAVRLFDRVRREFGHDLPISTLFRNQTVRQLAALLERDVVALEGPEAPWDTSTVIDPGPESGGAPFFVVGGVGGNVNNLFELGTLLGRKRPAIGFQTRGVQGHTPHASIEEMAAENIRYMRRHQPKGPYILAGYSGGAYTALEMTRQLEAEGATVERLFVLDTYAPGFAKDFTPLVRLTPRQRLENEISLMQGEGLGYFWKRVAAKARHVFQRGPVLELMKHFNLPLYRQRQVERLWMAAARRYEGGPIKAPVTLFRARPLHLVQKLTLEQDPTLGWKAFVAEDRLDTPWVKGDHLSMLRKENARTLAALIEDRLS